MTGGFLGVGFPSLYQALGLGWPGFSSGNGLTGRQPPTKGTVPKK